MGKVIVVVSQETTYFFQRIHQPSFPTFQAELDRSLGLLPVPGSDSEIWVFILIQLGRCFY